MYLHVSLQEWINPLLMSDIHVAQFSYPLLPSFLSFPFHISISHTSSPPLPTAHPLAEVVDLSVCVLDENGEQKTLYKTQFAYVTDQKQYMAQLLLGSVSDTAAGEGGGGGGGDGEGGGGKYPIFPPLPSAEALREYDQSLTDALMDSDLPPGWTLVGYNNHNTINSIQGMYVSTLHRYSPLHIIIVCMGFIEIMKRCY